MAQLRLVVANVQRQFFAESFQLERGSDGISSLRFSCTSAMWTPAAGQRVLLYDDAETPPRLLFAGSIDGVTSRWVRPGVVAYDVDAQSDEAVLDRRVVVRYYNQSGTGSLRETVRDLVESYLWDTSLTFDESNTDDLPLGPILLPGVMLRQAFDSIASALAIRWLITPDGKVRFTSDTSYMPEGPLATITDAHIMTGSVRRRSLRGSANRIYVRSSAFTQASEWTDLRKGDGARRKWPLTYQLQAQPTVKVNGTAQNVVDLAATQPTWPSGAVFAWSAGKAWIWHNPGLAALSSSDTIEIIYTTSLQYLAVAEPSPPPTTPLEMVVERNELPTKSAMLAVAWQELGQRIDGKHALQLTLMQGHWWPGMTSWVDWQSVGLSGRFVVENCSARLVGGSNMLYELSMATPQPMRPLAAADPVRYFETLLGRSDASAAAGSGGGGGSASGPAERHIVLVDGANPLRTGTDLMDNRYRVHCAAGKKFKLLDWTASMKSWGTVRIALYYSGDNGSSWTALFPTPGYIEISQSSYSGSGFTTTYLQRGDVLRYDVTQVDYQAGGLTVIIRCQEE